MRRVALGKPFGGILAWDSFFHLTPDAQRAMFPIFRAHAASGANWVFSTVLLQQRTIDAYRGRVFASEMLLVLGTEVEDVERGGWWDRHVGEVRSIGRMAHRSGGPLSSRRE